MKLIAKNTINLGCGKSAYPGDENLGEFEVADEKEAGKLIALGVAERKTRLVADDSDDNRGDPASDTSLPASGSTRAPDPDAVAAAAKAAKR